MYNLNTLTNNLSLHKFAFNDDIMRMLKYNCQNKEKVKRLAPAYWSVQLELEHDVSVSLYLAFSHLGLHSQDLRLLSIQRCTCRPIALNYTQKCVYLCSQF